MLIRMRSDFLVSGRNGVNCGGADVKGYWNGYLWPSFSEPNDRSIINFSSYSKIVQMEILEPDDTEEE
jgi:hypothetical protein